MKTIILILAAIAITGCDYPSQEEIETGPIGTVNVHVLADGTRCAVYKSYMAGGISCDWTKATVPDFICDIEGNCEPTGKTSCRKKIGEPYQAGKFVVQEIEDNCND